MNPESPAAASSSKNREQGQFRKFTYAELASATGYFSHSFVIGEGAGLGEVYKAQIENQVVAIKKLKLKAAEQQDESEFTAAVRALGALHHENLVKLIGYCCESGNRLVVSEYVPNKSLYFHLYGNASATMGWSTRVKIALGSAKALIYLHEICNPKIIHRDVKADNILLTDDFSPKVADFGHAMFFLGSSSITHISCLMKGIPVYADPEKQVSVKSDVYSFGVVLLELVSGRKPLVQKLSIVEWAKRLILQALGPENNIEELIDPELKKKEKELPINEIKMMICCAAASVYKPSKDRPEMKQIVQALEMNIPQNEIWDMNTDIALLRT